MNKLPKEKLQQIILVGIGTVAVLAGLWFVAIGKLNAKRKETGDQIAAMETKIEKGNQKRKAKEAVKKELEAAEKKLGALESGMAGGELFAWIDKLLNDFITENGMTGEVEFLSKSRGDIGEVGVLPKYPYKAVKYAVRGRAYYHEFGKFVAAFENRYPYIRLQNIELTPGDQLDSSDPERLGFRFEIIALQKPAETAQSAQAAK